MRGDRTLAVAYLRRSKEQAESRLGPEVQRAACEAWARREGVTLLSTHLDDDVSGATPLEGRPALLDALADVREYGAGILVVAKRDRLARDLSGGTIALIHREVALHGAIIVSADGQGNGNEPADLLMRNMLDAFAEHERAMIRSRTRAALARKRARGEKTGGLPPYGFGASEGILVPRDDEQAVIELILTLRHDDALTITQIVRTLTARGIVNRVGKPLHRKSIERILYAKVRDVA